MATLDLPDPKSLTDWSAAFAYPIPAVRHLSKQLHNGIAGNQQRLRSLVGDRYRELLSTAETIVDMDLQMEEVESLLENVGRKCNARALDRGVRAWAKADPTKGQRDEDRLAWLAQMRILQACPLIIGRVLRKNGSYLLAAKTILLSRLLCKTLTETTEREMDRDLVQIVQKQLTSLRRRLLARIERSFSRTDTSMSVLVESMCAFALATSSGLKDVVRHFFQRSRREAVERQLGKEEKTSGGVLEALKLYSRTVQDTHALLPKRLPDALLKVKTHPLLQDPELRNTIELNLDVYGYWVADDIKNFTPWIRHDDLTKTEAEKLLTEFARNTFDIFLKGLQRRLNSLQDFKLLVQLRKDLLETWLSSRARMPDLGSVNPLDALRDAFNSQMKDLVHARSKRLHLIGTEISATLEEWNSTRHPRDITLWGEEMLSMEISDGAPEFKRTILERYHGLTPAVRRIARSYESWFGFVEEVEATIKTIRENRWDDDFEDLDDDVESANLDELLSKSDSEFLHVELRKALQQAFTALDRQLQETVKKPAGEPLGLGQAMFLLRTMRQIRARPPSQCDIHSFGLSVVPKLHNTVVLAIVSSPLENFSRSWLRQTKMPRVPGRALWEGSPALPVQPSPSVFRLLQALVSTMTDNGSDIWSPSAIAVLKSHLQETTTEIVKDTLYANTREHLVNGNSNSKKDADEQQLPVDDAVEDESKHDPLDPKFDREGSMSGKQKDYLTQAYFDILVLENACGHKAPSSPGSKLSILGTEVKARLEIEITAQERLHKGAQEYWKRSYMLFALLA